MKSITIPTIFFAIILTSLVDSSNQSFDDFLERLESIVSSTPDVLPFMVKDGVIAYMEYTSDEFKEACVGYDAEAKSNHGVYSPVASLNSAIYYVFHKYKESATEYNHIHILSELQSVDPIGLIVHLTLSGLDKTSPTFMQSVVKFRQDKYKMVPITADGKIYISDFLKFVQRLKRVIDNSSSSDVLPFTLQVRVIASLWHSSNRFKVLCVRYDNKSKREDGNFSPETALKRTINKIFTDYKNAADGNEFILNLLECIQSVDPIGLDVYLKNNMVSEPSPTFMESVQTFQATMFARSRLFISRANNLYIDIFPGNSENTLYYIPEDVRNEITTEYKSFNHATIDFFIDIAMQQFPSIKMYHTSSYHSINDFKPYKSKEINDVQILFSGKHAVCIHYEASTRRVYIYDSMMYELDEKQREILRKLYPRQKNIVPQKSASRQGKSESCALFAIVYATMLLLGSDPTENAFAVNNVYGDEALYMRLHILNMFANRKLALME